MPGSSWFPEFLRAADLLGFDDAHFQPYPQLLAHSTEDSRKIVHVRVSPGRQHPVQAFARPFGQFGKLLEAERCVDKVAQDEARGLRFAVQEQRGRLVQQRFSEGRVALDALDHRLLEVSR